MEFLQSKPGRGDPSRGSLRALRQSLAVAAERLASKSDRSYARAHQGTESGAGRLSYSEYSREPRDLPMFPRKSRSDTPQIRNAMRDPSRRRGFPNMCSLADRLSQGK